MSRRLVRRCQLAVAKLSVRRHLLQSPLLHLARRRGRPRHCKQPQQQLLNRQPPLPLPPVPLRSSHRRPPRRR
mgnify:CR=1 FL=1